MIRIVIAEDQQMMLGALGSLLNLRGGYGGCRESRVMEKRLLLLFINYNQISV